MPKRISMSIHRRDKFIEHKSELWKENMLCALKVLKIDIGFLVGTTAAAAAAAAVMCPGLEVLRTNAGWGHTQYRVFYAIKSSTKTGRGSGRRLLQRLPPKILWHRRNLLVCIGPWPAQLPVCHIHTVIADHSHSIFIVLHNDPNGGWPFKSLHLVRDGENRYFRYTIQEGNQKKKNRKRKKQTNTHIYIQRLCSQWPKANIHSNKQIGFGRA